MLKIITKTASRRLPCRKPGTTNRFALAATVGSLVAITLTHSAGAQATLFTYSFDDVTASSGNSSAGGTANGVDFGNFTGSANVGANSSGAGRFSLTNWALGAANNSDTFTGTLDDTKYYEVTVAPQSGFTLNLDQITFILQRSGTGVRQYAVRSSVDSYGANLSAAINPANANLSVVTNPLPNTFQVLDSSTTANIGSQVTLSSAYDLLSAPVTFRFYGFNAEGTGGTFSLDNVAFIGSTNFVAARELLWNGTAGASAWNTTSTNWKTGTVATAFTSTDNVTFSDAAVAAGGTVVVDAAGVAPNNVTVSNTSGTYTINGGAIAGTGVLTKTGAGTLVLGATYANAVSVTGGTLRLGADERLGDGAPLSLTNATFDLNGFQETVGALTLNNSTVSTGAGTLILGGAATVSGTNTINGTVGGSAVRDINMASASVLTVNGALSGPNRLQFRGAGTLNVSSDNAGFSGNFSLNDTVLLNLGNKGAFGSNQIFLNGGTINSNTAFTDTNAIQNTVSLGGNATLAGAKTEWAGEWTFAFTGAQNRTVTVNNQTVISGNLTGGDDTLNVAGTGTLSLNGVASSLATLNVQGATVLVGGGLSANVVTIKSGLLGGAGGINGPITIGDGTGTADATLSPGDGIGVLTTLGLTFLSDAVLKLELNSGTLAADKLVALGDVNLGTSTVLSLTDLGNLTLGKSTAPFLILDNQGTLPVIGEFAGLAQGAPFTVGKNVFSVNYTGGDGNDITLVVVPEPSAAASLLAAGLALGARRRRR